MRTLVVTIIVLGALVLGLAGCDSTGYTPTRSYVSVHHGYGYGPGWGWGWGGYYPPMGGGVIIGGPPDIPDIPDFPIAEPF